MKRRINFLAVLAGALVIVRLVAAEPQVFPAVAWHDCAPWDGPAFTIAIGKPGAKSVDTERPLLQIAIWHSAESRPRAALCG